MTNLNVLETFRTKEELVKYFKEIGENVTDEEIDKLKANYEQIEQNKSHLTMKELDNVAGGGGSIFIHQLGVQRVQEIGSVDFPLYSITLRDGKTIPTCSVTLRDGKTIPECDVMGSVDHETRNVFVKFGDNPIIDLSGVGKGRYAVEIATIDAANGPSFFGSVDPPVYVRLNASNHRTYTYSRRPHLIDSVNIHGYVPLRDLQKQEPELYSAVFANPNTISFIEAQSQNLGPFINAIPPIPEPDPQTRTYLENLILSPPTPNDNPVEPESRCTIM